jgi:hypothetical protein
MTIASLTRKRHIETVSVEVDVDISDLVENGWHHEDECPGKEPPSGGEVTVGEAVRSLHVQAHPSQHPDPFLCQEEPCRSLPSEVTMARMGRGQ